MAAVKMFIVTTLSLLFLIVMFFVLQLLLERKSTEVGKLIEETEKNIKDLAENINQAKVCSLKPLYYLKITPQGIFLGSYNFG